MKVLAWIDKNLERVVLTALLALLACLCMYQIIMRLLNSSSSWSEELSRYLLVWSGFFTIGFCIRKSTALKLDFLLNLMPRKIQGVLLTISTLFMLVLLSYLTYGAWELVVSTKNMDSVTPGLGIPTYFVYVGPLIGLALGVIRSVQNLFLTRCYRDYLTAAKEAK